MTRDRMVDAVFSGKLKSNAVIHKPMRGNIGIGFNNSSENADKTAVLLHMAGAGYLSIPLFAK